MLENYMSPFDATVVERIQETGPRLFRQDELRRICDGFDHGQQRLRKTFNPWNEHVVPGGSSGGSASCVAARLTPVATATDTGGSIRQPAAFCGVTGIKPTYGRPSRWGMIAFASSLDTAGVIAQTAEDCAAVFFLR